MVIMFTIYVALPLKKILTAMRTSCIVFMNNKLHSF